MAVTGGRGGCTGLLASPLPGRVWLSSGGITACPSGCAALSSSSLFMAISSHSLYRTTEASCRPWARTPGGRRPCTSPGGRCWLLQPTYCMNCSPSGRDGRLCSLPHHPFISLYSALRAAGLVANGVIGTGCAQTMTGCIWESLHMMGFLCRSRGAC